MIPDINLNSNEEIKNTHKGYYVGKYFKILYFKLYFYSPLNCCKTQPRKTIIIKLYYWAYNIQRSNFI